MTQIETTADAEYFADELSDEALDHQTDQARLCTCTCRRPE